MRKMLYVAAFATLAACGYSEDKFADESLEATCEWLVECFELFDDVDTCIDESEPVEADDDCEYDSGAAKDCVEGLQELTCDDMEAPAACNDAYDCPATDSGM